MTVNFHLRRFSSTESFKNVLVSTRLGKIAILGTYVLVYESIESGNIRICDYETMRLCHNYINLASYVLSSALCPLSFRTEVNLGHVKFDSFQVALNLPCIYH